MLTREIGFRVAQQGTTAAGVKAITDKLVALGLPTTGLVLTDGSGLDRGDRMTCQLLAGVLDLGARPQFTTLWSGLGVAGQSGRLITELAGTALEGKLRAKTGSLDGVTGLVGLIDVGRPLRFAFVANGTFADTGGITLRDRIATIIATFPQSPPPDALVPGPVSGATS
jgi:D-alanyl-D-alanine carboxypeptidase/D-alanyl-D-alanine-endopeptidase (penicillin-binding protein 4)